MISSDQQLTLERVCTRSGAILLLPAPGQELLRWGLTLPAGEWLICIKAVPPDRG